MKEHLGGGTHKKDTTYVVSFFVIRCHNIDISNFQADLPQQLPQQ